MKKGQRFILSRPLDLRPTGGPLLPEGTPGTIVRVRKTGELWVNLDGFGHRHLLPQDLTVQVCPLCAEPIYADEEIEEGEYGLCHHNCLDFGELVFGE